MPTKQLVRYCFWCALFIAAGVKSMIESGAYYALGTSVVAALILARMVQIAYRNGRSEGASDT
jgi:hypothetical protein